MITPGKDGKKDLSYEAKSRECDKILWSMEDRIKQPSVAVRKLFLSTYVGQEYIDQHREPELDMPWNNAANTRYGWGPSLSGLISEHISEYNAITLFGNTVRKALTEEDQRHRGIDYWFIDAEGIERTVQVKAVIFKYDGDLRDKPDQYNKIQTDYISLVDISAGHNVIIETPILQKTLNKGPGRFESLISKSTYYFNNKDLYDATRRYK